MKYSEFHGCGKCSSGSKNTVLVNLFTHSLFIFSICSTKAALVLKIITLQRLTAFNQLKHFLK